MKAETKYWQKLRQDKTPVSGKTYFNRIEKGRAIKAARLEQARLYQENLRAKKLAEFERVGSWKAALLSDEELSRFKSFVESGKHRLGKASFKPYNRVSREVFNDSDLDSMVSHLMKEHFPVIYEEARLNRLAKRNRTLKRGYRGRTIRHDMVEKDGYDLVNDEDGNDKIPMKMKPDLWLQTHEGNSIGRPKRRAFIEYVKAGNHRKGEGKLSIKSYVQMAKELNVSAVSCSEWMLSSFPATYYQKERLHSSYAKRAKAKMDLNITLVQTSMRVSEPVIPTATEGLSREEFLADRKF